MDNKEIKAVPKKDFFDTHPYTLAFAAGASFATAVGAIAKQRLDYTDLALLGGITAAGYAMDTKRNMKKEVKSIENNV